MVFSSVEFLFFFLPITALIYFTLPLVLKNLLLLLSSIFFYLWGSGELVLLLLASIIFNYFSALLVEKYIAENKDSHIRVILFLSILFNLSLLAYFKYANFFVSEIYESFGFNSEHISTFKNIILPIGISFYTFQAISYVVDVARKESPALKNPIDFGMYIAMFPQLIAGPIVRYKYISKQINPRARKIDLESFKTGSLRFYWGLTKKVIFADPCGEIANAVFDQSGGDITTSAAWIGLLCYTLQIYFDFSGYSDMAIGLGKIFGFDFPENFKRPYSATSITDFWRRWHMTLSNWFRDYVYIPLGGSQRSSTRTTVNLFIVFLLTGIWHGANWTFILWGLYHGTLLFIERVTGYRDSAQNYVILKRIVTVILVMCGWVLFRAESLASAMMIYEAMFFDWNFEVPTSLSALMTNWHISIITLSSVVFLLPKEFNGTNIFIRSHAAYAVVARLMLLVIGLPLALSLVVGGSFNAFLYFQF